ncbi:hypothetical protein ABK040_008281 [Willaertia magna]
MSCCDKKSVESTSSGIVYDNASTIYQSVQEYYGKVLNTSKDLKTSACTSVGKPHPIILSILDKIPSAVNEKFYGCGTPIPLGIENLSVLDLGSGSGRDCYIAAALCGKNGKVIGVDMTKEQIQVAQNNVEEFKKNFNGNVADLKFIEGFIENLENLIEKESIDLVISNCVVNLSPNKEDVLKGVYHSLKRGGEFYFSDVYCDRRLSENVRNHELLFGECIAGALYINDFISLSKKIGFNDPRQMSINEIKINDPQLKGLLGKARFYSITYRLFKLDNLENNCEDYGQVAIYNGKIIGQPHSFILDDHHEFETNKPALVCGNTASMLEETWLKNYFTIIGNRNVHFGAFDCSGSTVVNNSTGDNNSCGTSNNSACGGGKCC